MGGQVYLVQWGFYSDLSGECGLKSIWSTKELAIRSIKREVNNRRHKIPKSEKSTDLWTDGDYWISVSEVNLDSEYLYSLKK